MISRASVVSGSRQDEERNPESGIHTPVLHDNENDSGFGTSFSSWEERENEVSWQFYDDGVPMQKGKNKKQQPRNSRKNSSKSKKIKNKGRNCSQNYDREDYDEISSRHFDALQDEFENVFREKGRLSIEKCYTEQVSDCYKRKLEQAKKDLSTLKGQLECAAQEKNQRLKEKDQIINNLQEMVKCYKQKAEQSMEDLNTLRDELNDKQIAFNKFVEEFHSTREDLSRLIQELEYRAQEKNRIQKEKDQILNNLQKSEESVDYYRRNFQAAMKDLSTVKVELNEKKIAFAKFEQELNSTKENMSRLKEELEYWTQEKLWLLKEKDQTLNNLQKSEERVDYYKRNSEVAMKDLSKLKLELNDKEIAFAKFVEETKNVGPTDDVFECHICMEPCTESAEHNLCSLDCGHFFGRPCIMRWITQMGAASSKCPICQKIATLQDIRRHYV